MKKTIFVSRDWTQLYKSNSMESVFNSKWKKVLACKEKM